MFFFSEFIKLNKKTVLFIKNGCLCILKNKKIVTVSIIGNTLFSISNSNFLKLTFSTNRLKKKELYTLCSILFTIKKKIENFFWGGSFFYNTMIFLNGVGYKILRPDTKTLSLKIGNSHDILINIPQEIDVFCFKENLLVLKSFSKESLGNFTSNLASYQFPDAYEFKGLVIQNMSLFRKKKKKK